MDVIMRARDIPPDLLEFFEPANPMALKDTWTLGPEPFRGAHFATFPTELARRCIAMGTSEKGACPKCGAPWERVVEHARGGPSTEAERREAGNGILRTAGHRISGGLGSSPTGKCPGSDTRGYPTNTTTTTGWRPTCECGAGVRPAVVLDPFGGSGTVGVVADRLGRDAILIDLNPEYSAMQRQRVTADAGMFAQVAGGE